MTIKKISGCFKQPRVSVETIDTGNAKRNKWQAKHISQFFNFYAGADKVSGETLPLINQIYLFSQTENL